MRITELLSKKAIDLNVSVKTKADVIDYMTNLQDKAGDRKSVV